MRPTLFCLILAVCSQPLQVLAQSKAPAKSNSGHPIIALQGRVQHMQGRELVLTDNYGNQILETQIPANGNFQFRARWSYAQPATLRIGQHTAALWLTPGDNLTITVDAQHFTETLRYSGRGSRANNYRATDVLTSRRIFDAYHRNLVASEKQFVTWLSQVRQQAAARLQHAFPHPTASETAFINYQRGDMDFLRYRYYERNWDSDRLTRPGVPALAFRARDQHGQPFSLASLQGKWVYVDFWTSWCGFCRGEAAVARSLRVALADHIDDVVFLNVSIDESWDKWQCAVEADGVEGINVISPDSGRANAAATYRLASLPRYIIVGPNGCIVNGNAPRPSTGQAEQLLRKLLDENQAINNKSK